MGAKPCGPCAARSRAGGDPSFRASGAAAQAAAAPQYEVITAAGTPTGRRFTSLVAATGYANRIGGSTRPV